MEAPYVTIGQIASVGFFFYFAITPILGKCEARLIKNFNACEARSVLASFLTSIGLLQW